MMYHLDESLIEEERPTNRVANFRAMRDNQD